MVYGHFSLVTVLSKTGCAQQWHPPTTPSKPTPLAPCLRRTCALPFPGPIKRRSQRRDNVLYRRLYTGSRSQLVELYGYIAEAASPEIAARFTDSIVTYCESLSTFPNRGNRREDIRPGLRVTSYRKRVAIAFDVDEDRVNIIGVFYGGQDYESVLSEEE